MISLHNNGETFKISISGIFDFDASRELLRKSKIHAQAHSINKIEVHLEGITSCNSCAIGALILLAEKAPGGFGIQLKQCSDDVWKLFNSGFLDRYFQITKNTPAKQSLPCDSCHEAGCQQPTPTCEHAHFLGPDVYPLIGNLL